MAASITDTTCRHLMISLLDALDWDALAQRLWREGEAGGLAGKKSFRRDRPRRRANNVCGLTVLDRALRS